MARLSLTTVAIPLLLLVAVDPRPALAQPAPTPAPQAPAGAAPPDTLQPPPPPKPIEVDELALSPVPPAPHVLGSWQEALSFVNRRAPDLIIAEQEVIRAEALSRQALGAALPTLNATGNVTHYLVTGESPTYSFGAGGGTGTGGGTGAGGVGGIQVGKQTLPQTPVATATLTLTQPILAPRAWYGIGTARRQVESARYSLDDRRRTLLASVASNVVSVVTAERVSEINRVGLRSALERLELTRRQTRLGTGTRLDVVRAEQDVATARATLVTGDESLRQAREALGLALGMREPYGVPATISLNEIEQDMRASCAAASPDQRADVLAARKDLEVAERGVTDAKLAFAPHAEASSTLLASTQEQINGKKYQWSIGALLTIPLYDGGVRYGTLRAARAQAEEQRARLDATTRGALLDATQAMRAVSVADQSRVVAEQVRDLARETARLTQISYQAGTATSFDLVESGRRQREAELDLAVKEFQLVKAKIAALLAAASCR